mgnify:CR=1 FL=1
MAQTNVAQFAKELGVPSSLLLEQLQAAGVNKQLVDDTLLTEQDKTQLLEYLRAVTRHRGSQEQDHPHARDRPPRSRKRTAPGKARTIQVEVRKKRVLVKRDAAPAVPGGGADTTTCTGQRGADRNSRRGSAASRPSLIARQAADAVAKQEQQKKRKEAQEPVAEASPPPTPETKPAEAPSAAVAADVASSDTAAAAEAKPVASGTLHKPATKPGETADKKPPKKQVKQVVWRDESVKKRTIKTRGDEGGAGGWHAREGPAREGQDGDQYYICACVFAANGTNRARGSDTRRRSPSRTWPRRCRSRRRKSSRR